MHDLRIFYLRVCFTLFINVQFSNAHRERITNPNQTFAYTASIYSLFVQGPKQRNFTQHLSVKPMLLAVHNDYVTLSFYESDAPYTFLTFKQRHVDFELMYAETMVFSVKEGNDLWHFRCVFSADKNLLDIMHSYLSLCSAQGLMVYRADIDKVESYVRMDRTRDPIIETVEDLEPAKLYDQEIKNGDSSKKIYSITEFTSRIPGVKVPRLVFRTGNFEIRRVESIVVLKIKACSNWFYIFYFRTTRRALTFMKYLVPFDSLNLPPDVHSYVKAIKVFTSLLNQ